MTISSSATAEDLAVGPLPDSLRTQWHLSKFYTKGIVAGGLPIISSDKPSDYALKEARFLIDRMLEGRDDLRQAIVKQHVRMAVMAYSEMTTMIPEHSDLQPTKYWDKRARGLGATHARPAVSCAEENLLEYPGDPYVHENILIHEFAHVIHEIALAEVDPTFDGRLRKAFDQAQSEGLWKGTYAGTNHKEYWAEAVQCWFQCGRTDPPQHNHVRTRAQLQEYDPRVAKLIAEVFRNGDWIYTAPSQRSEAGHLTGFDRAKAPRFAWPAGLVEWNKKYEEEQREKQKK
ncbi:MAG TPA: hypothetical protein VFE24_15195 [Pirellulales bacterium]|nr:hypothetical protein [Pirellulales bacterium]